MVCFGQYRGFSAVLQRPVRNKQQTTERSNRTSGIYPVVRVLKRGSSNDIALFCLACLSFLVPGNVLSCVSVLSRVSTVFVCVYRLMCLSWSTIGPYK